MNLDCFNQAPEMKQAIQCSTAKEIKAFFKSIREMELSRLQNLSEKELTELQARVNIISEIEHLFLLTRDSNRTS